MDLRLTAEQERLRAEVRAWLATVMHAEIEGFPYSEEEDPAALRAFNKLLAWNGWIAPAWPREYGGMELGAVEQLVFGEEMAYARAPNGGRGPAVGYAGPTIMLAGTEEQKRRHLPGREPSLPVLLSLSVGAGTMRTRVNPRPGGCHGIRR